MLARLIEDIRAERGLDLAENPQALGRLREEVEKAKHALAELPRMTLQIPLVGKAAGAASPYVRSLSRAEFESWTADLLDRLETPCRAVLEDGGLEPRDVDHLLLVGGATRMPAVVRKLERIFGRPAARTASPDEAVAIGAATMGAILDGRLEDLVVVDATACTIGVRGGDGRFWPIIPRNSPVPTRQRRVFATRVDGQSDLSLDVFAGEHADVRQNRHLGTFTVGRLPDAPAGHVLCAVDFTVDANGLLRVEARDLMSGEPAEVRRVAACGLSRSEVRRLAAAARSA